MAKSAEKKNGALWSADDYLDRGRLRTLLKQLADPSYRDFQAKLLPGTRGIIGVRLPVLRRLARQIAKRDLDAYLCGETGESFEETMLRGMVIGYGEADLEIKLGRIRQFVPLIDNWSVCDSFCSGLKPKRDQRERYWEFIAFYARDHREFHIRFGLVMMLFYYVDDEYVDRVLEAADRADTGLRYASTAAAWAVSACYASYPQKTLRCLERSGLDDDTYNMAIQKILESLKTGEREKEGLRAMKRKKQDM